MIKNNLTKLFELFLFLIVCGAGSYNCLACGDNTQGGNRLCPALEINGNHNPCIGATETYSIAPYSQGGSAQCAQWYVNGGVVVGGDNEVLTLPYYNNYQTCTNAASPHPYDHPNRGLASITVRWGYDINGNLINPPPTYGYIYLQANGLHFLPFWGCDDHNDDGKHTDFAFNFAATPVQSIGAISGNANPSCGWGTLTYSIPVVTNDATYAWTIPAGWTAYTSLNGKYLNTIQVRANGTPPNTSITGGYVTVTVTQPCGPTLSQSLAINGNNALSAGIGGPTQICKSNPIDLVSVVSGGTQPYTYNWSTTSGTLNCSACTSPVYTPQQADIVLIYL